ncbi:MAG: hypothetical protein L6R40_007691 [Gallowayella cf. fulva]|nr:MAG: hypothetical protein L6R40_007691 [Xanthomendoza cf. fulva]
MAPHPGAAEVHPASDQLLLSTLSASASTFLQPTPALHTAALVLAKRYLDPLALSATEAQAERLQSLRLGKKRRHAEQNAFKRPFHLRHVHLEGFPTQQIWEQARRVLDASTQEVEAGLQQILPPQHDQRPTVPPELSHDDEPRRKRVRFDDDPSGDGNAVRDDLAGPSSAEDDAGLELASNTTSEASLGAIEDVEEDDDDGVDGEDPSIEMDSEAMSDIDGQPRDIFVPDKHGLNDGFFSIDDFNKQSDFLENQDARGQAENEVSDEEEIDWAAEPPPLLPDVDGDGLEQDDDSPTFGNADLDADTDSDVSEDLIPMEGMGPSSNTNDIMYADFFAPPPRKATKTTRMRALPKTQPASVPGPQQEDDIDRTIAAVRRDIFEDDLSAGEDSEEANSVFDPGDPRSRRSNHERRQAKLAEEIRRLEAANVAKRDWTLSGEARAADRPLNSLLEEDLEFERTGKPVPVITNEVSEDIEALIKRRIINRDFDEVLRRRPGDLATGAATATRRGRFELDDTKPQQSLAEVYEAEHLKRTDPDAYIDKRDAKLKQEHAAIEALWANLAAKLDSLSNWHYKPRPPQASITVVADVPKISMEDARPSAAEGMGPETSMLAPQEVYRPGEERSKEDKRKEVVLKSGIPVARGEMSREQKVRRRRREKERIRKNAVAPVATAAAAASTAGVRKKAERKGVVGDLKRGGVMVIGKKGELVDVEGKGVRGSKGAVKGGGNFKL